MLSNPFLSRFWACIEQEFSKFSNDRLKTENNKTDGHHHQKPSDTYDFMLDYLKKVLVRPTLEKLKVQVSEKENTALNGALLSASLLELGCYGSNAALRNIYSAKSGPCHGAIGKIAATQKRAARSSSDEGSVERVILRNEAMMYFVFNATLTYIGAQGRKMRFGSRPPAQCELMRAPGQKQGNFTTP